MSASASAVFDLLAKAGAQTFERYEVRSAAFGTLRRSVRRIVLALRETDEGEALDIANRLRALLSEWLTVPVPFDESLQAALGAVMGDAGRVRTRWGSDIATDYGSAVRSAQLIKGVENPV